MYINLFQNLLLLIAMFLITLSIVPINKLIIKLAKNQLNKKWKIIRNILYILLSYISMYFLFNTLINYNNNIINIKDIIYYSFPLCIFLTSFFIYIVSSLTLDFKHLTNLQKENITDALMNINNRRYFDIMLEEKFNICKNYNIPMSLILIDIDNFKLINDNYGHLIGDEVLKHCSKLIKKSIRNNDIFCRYGGEELSIICENATKSNAYIIAEKIRTMIENTPYVIDENFKSYVDNYEYNKKLFYTVSIGLEEIDKNIDSIDNLISNTDKNLYIAKNKGKNITIY